MPSRSLGWRLLKPAAFLLALVPLVYLLWQALDGRLSANPIDDITDTTGTWTLRFVLITLAVRPVRRIPGFAALGGFRRMAGLFAFFYGLLHLTTYLWLDQFFDVPEILKDVAKRPFITVGVSAFLLMVPLALTSTQGMMRRLGGRRWKALHRLVYLTAIGGVIHYLWLVKADRQRPLIYGAILALLLGYRIWEAVRSRRASPPTPTTTNHGTI
jgi:sulfoxide reductase heme-binding subunit YedZ